MRSILPYGCETWAVGVEDVRMLQIFGNDSIRRIQRVSRTDRVPSVELRRRVRPTSMLVQRRLRRYGHVARRPEGQLIKDLFLPAPPHTWRR